MLQISTNYQKDECVVFLIDEIRELKKYKLENSVLLYFQNQSEKDLKQIVYNSGRRVIIAEILKESDFRPQQLEFARQAAFKTLPYLNNQKYDTVTVVNAINDSEILYAYAEGLALSNYQYLQHFKDSDKRRNSISNIKVYSSKIKEKDVSTLNNILESVYEARNLINQPPNYLTATTLADRMKELGKACGLQVTTLDKTQIAKEGMGGLLAVNRGSVEPPTFTILEWKHKKAKNKKPFVLVGKGVTYDTGGLSLKPTDGMDSMKADMSGAAGVFATMIAIAKSDLNLNVTALIPATDNRPGGNAYTNGDVITMHNGLTVEVLNTDAEGRMILADALSYAAKLKPELVIDMATLTGAASQAVGKEAIVAMGNDKKQMKSLIESSFNVWERIVEFPFWDDYAEYLKSDVADMKNIGGKQAGAITAGKFLEKFTSYPYIHLDIAGSAFLPAQDSYRGKGAVGVGVRLLYDFLKKQV